MPTFERESRISRPGHYKRGARNSMASPLLIPPSPPLFPMSADRLGTCIKMTETDENCDGSNVKDSRVLLLDCRSFVAYNEGHVAEALNVHCPAILRRRSKGPLPLRTLLPGSSGNSARTLLAAGLCHPIVLYDELGANSKNNASEPSIVNFVAECLHAETGIKTLFYLEGGYYNFSQLYPHLCVSPFSGDISQTTSPSVLSCPVITWPLTTRSSPVLPLSSKTFREHHGVSHYHRDYEIGPVEILPHLWLGCAGDAARPELLHQLGITALLNVSRTGACPDLLLAKDGTSSSHPTFRYKNIPLRDSSCQVIDCFFQEAFDFIDEEKRLGGKVLVHCRAGVSRSATICIAYLMASKRLRMEDAYEHVKSRRRVVSPNFNFMGQLLAFERQIFNSGLSPRPGSPLPASEASTPDGSIAIAPSHGAQLRNTNVPAFDFGLVSPSYTENTIKPWDQIGLNFP